MANETGPGAASKLPIAALVAPRRGLIAIAAATLLSLYTLAGARQDASAAAQKRDKKSKGEKNRKSKDKRKHKQDASGSGDDVVRVAKKYKGVKYVWGGESPRGFDCSGFTWYCFQQATGMDIGRVEDDQWKRGKSVGKGEWRAGDLVFFKNTFEKGLSHVGIYTNGGKFIHAENESTGVVISTLESGYYDEHYAGARRLV